MADARHRERSALERRWLQLVGHAPAHGPSVGVDVVRDEVLASWARSARTLDPDIDHAPFVEDAVDRWRDSTVAEAFAEIAGELERAALDGDFVAAATDADGTIVWTAGSPRMRRRAERVAFTAGGRWDEASVGTNALALALRDGRPATVWSAEHFAPIVHDWVCYSAPIIDPGTGATLGVLDLSTTWRRSTPLASTTLNALARVMGLALADTRSGLVVPGHHVELRTLGRSDVVVDGARLPASPRHVEILTVLSLAADGLSLDQLHDRLHGEQPVAIGTTKADLSHLRRAVADVVASRPYRIVAPVSADHLEVLAALARGDVGRALAVYGGPLLPRSAAPAIEEQRRVIEVALRTAVLHRGSPEQLLRLGELLPQDVQVHERTLARMAPDDPRRALVVGRLAVARPTERA